MKVLIIVSACLLATAFGQRQLGQHQQQQQQQQQQYQQYQSQEEPQYQKQPAQPAQQAVQQQQYQQQSQQTHQIPKETTTWIPILKYNKQQGDDGSYKTEYETGNQIIAEESGFIKDKSEALPGGVLVQHGQYSYVSPEGDVVNVQYTADEKGFQATGDHIPTPPPIPAEIQKGLDQIYEGIRLNKERDEAEARSNPAEYAKKQEERARLNYNGQYYP